MGAEKQPRSLSFTEFPDGKQFPHLQKTERIILEELIRGRKEGSVVLRVKLVVPLYDPQPDEDLRKHLPKVNRGVTSLRIALTASGWWIVNATDKKGKKIVGGLELKKTGEFNPTPATEARVN